MGTVASAPLRVTGNSVSDVITAALGVGPEKLPSSLVPLLKLDLHGLCEAYHRLADRGRSEVDARDLERDLGLPHSASKEIAARRSSVPCLELLVLLAVLSHTHALGKARFIHAASDRNGSGRLKFEEFRSAAAALLKAACFLARIPRGQWPKTAAVDVLVRPLFAPYEAGISKEASVSLLMKDNGVGKLLHRFSRGAVDQHFVLASWPSDATRLDDSSPGRHSTARSSVLPSCDDTQPIKVGHGITTYGLAPPPCLFKVMSRSRRKSSCPQPSLRDVDTRRKCVISRAGTPFSLYAQSPKASKPANAPTRRRYLTSPPSQESAEATRSREAEGTEGQEELRSEASNSDRQRSYRRDVEDLRNGSLSLPADVGILPPGCFWTASEEHVACGGDLPPRCTRPLTPKLVQNCISSRAGVSGGTSNTARRESSSRVAPQAKVIRSSSSRLRASLEICQQFSKLTEDDTSQLSSFLDEETLARNRRHVYGLGVNENDVLLAFELYRASYWKCNVEDNVQKTKRDSDMDAIISEFGRDLIGRGSTEHVRTFRSFLTTLWPFATLSDLHEMLKWITQSKTPEPAEIAAPLETRCPQRQAETLRELVELFDDIDKHESGTVPIEAVEEFLCGELVTSRERERLAELRKLDCGGNVGVRAPAGCEAYVDLIKNRRRYRFLTFQVKDQFRFDMVPETERRWAGLQHRFSGPASAAADSQGSTNACKSNQIALSKLIGKRMEKLARFLDEETGRPQQDDKTALVSRIFGKSGGDATIGSSSAHMHPSDEDDGISCGDLECATTPHLVPKYAMRHFEEDSAADDHPGDPRMVRLYWRYLLGSAVQQQLRDSDQPCYLNLRTDGRVDLVGFVSILAQDHLRGLFPKGSPPTADVIRATAYAQ